MDIENIDFIYLPQYEDDMFIFRHENFKLTKRQIDYVVDDYLFQKRFMFQNLIVDPKFLKNHSDRPSLRNIGNMFELTGSIYTRTYELRNKDNYINLKHRVKDLLEKGSRRCIVRFSNDFSEYYASEMFDNSIDCTCLSSIHYIWNPFDPKKPMIRISFRASDIQNELFQDILTIYEFFVAEIFGWIPIDLTFIISTSQNIFGFEYFMKKMEKI